MEKMKFALQFIGVTILFFLAIVVAQALLIIGVFKGILEIPILKTLIIFIIYAVVGLVFLFIGSLVVGTIYEVLKGSKK